MWVEFVVDLLSEVEDDLHRPVDLPTCSCAVPHVTYKDSILLVEALRLHNVCGFVLGRIDALGRHALFKRCCYRVHLVVV